MCFSHYLCSIRRLSVEQKTILRKTSRFSRRLDNRTKSRNGSTPDTYTSTTSMAAIGTDRISTLRYKHLYQSGMGRREGRSQTF